MNSCPLGDAAGTQQLSQSDPTLFDSASHRISETSIAGTQSVAGRRFERVTQLASVGIATSPHDRRRPSFPEYDYHFAKDKTLRLAARQSSY